MAEMQEQGKTGKIYNAGVDRWGRPVVIFNNSVNNSNDPRAQMRYLAFNLEMALRKARAGGANVAKFVIFMHMCVRTRVQLFLFLLAVTCVSKWRRRRPPPTEPTP